MISDDVLDDHRLARGLAAGSAAAWHQLYDAYSKAVWRCVARRVGPHQAEVADIVQETFLAAARSARTFEPARGSLWGWLSGIARRQAALHYRRKQTRPEAGGDETNAVGNALRGVPGAADHVGPAELLLIAETAQIVRRALDGLSLEYETLLVGKYMDGLSLEDLAAAEDASVEAISSKLARARRAFREAFERLDQPARRVSEGAAGAPLRLQA